MIAAVLGASFIALVLIGLGHEMRLAIHLRRAGLFAEPQKRRHYRRLAGLLFLTLAVAMVVNLSVLEHRVHSPFICMLWLLGAFFFVILSVALAFREMAEIGSMARDETEKAAKESFDRLQLEIDRIRAEKRQEQNLPSPPSPPPPSKRGSSKKRKN